MSARAQKNCFAASKSPKAEDLRKASLQVFDVFLCHNSNDNVVVKDIAFQLQQRGIHPWLDEWELSPFVRFQDALQKVIPRLKAAAVFVGPSGVGPWEDFEIQALLQEFVRRKVRMGLVFLPGCPSVVKLPLFMKLFNWVDFRRSNPDPFEQLIWGITGVKPSIMTEDKVPFAKTGR